MTRRKTLGMLLALGLVACIVMRGFCHREPSYQGRKLSLWLTEATQAQVLTTARALSATGTYAIPLPQSISPSPQKAATAEIAVRAIGTNAIPFLLPMVSTEDPFRNIYNHLPQRPRNWMVCTLGGRFRSRLNEGEVGFSILGSSATNAILPLTVLMNNTKSEETADSAAGALACIGKDALPALVKSMTNTNWSYRYYAFHHLVDLHTNARPAIPKLIEYTASRDAFTVTCACETLGRLQLEPETVVPALANCLNTTNPRVRFYATEALKRYGSLARPAVPMLKKLLIDPDPTVRSDTRGAVKAIAPELLTNSVPAQ